jgi:hypothetical protein
MNQTLYQFSLAAGGSHYPSINPKLQQAFAELIIRKCAELADQPLATQFQTPGDVVRHYFNIDHDSN